MTNQTFSIRLSDEYQEIFNKLHENANEVNPISKFAFFEKVIDFYANPKVKEVEVLRDTPETTAKLEELQKSIEELKTENESLLISLSDCESKLDESDKHTESLLNDYDSKQKDYLQQITDLQGQVNTANARNVNNKSL